MLVHPTTLGELRLRKSISEALWVLVQGSISERYMHTEIGVTGIAAFDMLQRDE
jgi:hypothetical protein